MWAWSRASLFVGNFTGRPGQLDLVTVNAGSNDLTLIPDFLQAGQPLEISSGGTNPVAALAGDFNGDRLTDLLVANNGDCLLSLFLGGRDGLDLAESMVDPAVPHPTALALDVLTGNLLQFYAGTEVVEAATLLAFYLGDKGEGVGGEVARQSPQPSSKSPGCSRSASRSLADRHAAERGGGHDA